MLSDLINALDEAVSHVLAELETAGPKATREAKRLLREGPGDEETTQVAARLRASP